MPNLTIPFSRSRAGATAVEFALTCPIFILMLFASICYGVYIGTLHSIQQLAAEAARAAVAGLSTAERSNIAKSFVQTNITAYPLLDARKTVVSVADGGGPDYAFSVSVSLDMTNSFIFQFRNLIPLPAAQMTRSAVIRRGGY